jgi:hypothetical protein
MSKSLLNFRVQISKALVNSKNPIFNSKIFLLHFRPSYPYRPTRPSAQPALLAPLLPQAKANFAGPSRSAHTRRWRICKNTFSSLIYAFRSRRLLSIHPLTHGPNLSVLSSPPRRPTPAVFPMCPIKATPRTPGALHTSPRSSLLLSRAGTPHHRVFLTATARHDAQPPHRRSCHGEPPTALPAHHSLSSAPWSAPVDTGVAGGRSSGEPGAAVHGRSTVDRDSGGPQPRGPGLREILYENNSLNQYFLEFCKEAPMFLCN